MELKNFSTTKTILFMANCSKYMELSPKEKTEYVGRLIHAVMSSDTLFDVGNSIIMSAEKKGLFEGVTINPSEADQPKPNS